MRICPNCGELTMYDSATCSSCLAVDLAWQEALYAAFGGYEPIKSIARNHVQDQDKQNQPPIFQQSSLFDIPPKKSGEKRRIRLSAHTDSGRLGFELDAIKDYLAANKNEHITIELDAVGWGHTWDYLADSDPDRDVFLPPNLPLLAIVESMRLIVALRELNERADLELVLPPKNHAATVFIQQTGLTKLADRVLFSQVLFDETAMQGSDDVLVPLTFVGTDTGGQLQAAFYETFSRLNDAGHIKGDWRSPLLKIVMEAAENADTWGGGQGYVVVFLRQENRGRRSFHTTQDFIPERETHLFIHVFSVLGSLGQSLGMNEQDAATAVQDGLSSRTFKHGLGMPFIIHKVTHEASGTVFINSGGFTRVASPDGLKRDFYSAGCNYLPGVHLGVIVPLAVISDRLQITTTSVRASKRIVQ